MSIEAMKLALEALEINLVFLRNVKPFKGQEDLASDCVAMTEETIISLRQAIEQAEKQKPVAFMQDSIELYVKEEKDEKRGYVIPLYTTPQPQQAEKQEPFGWVSQHTVKGPYEWQFNKELSGVYRDNAISILPVYTTPQPQEFVCSTGLCHYKTAAHREWVGLTQEDIDIAFDDTQEGGGFNDFARAIEQRLKEKNT